MPVFIRTSLSRFIPIQSAGCTAGIKWCEWKKLDRTIVTATSSSTRISLSRCTNAGKRWRVPARVPAASDAHCGFHAQSDLMNPRTILRNKARCRCSPSRSRTCSDQLLMFFFRLIAESAFTPQFHDNTPERGCILAAVRWTNPRDFSIEYRSLP